MDQNRAARVWENRLSVEPILDEKRFVSRVPGSFPTITLLSSKKTKTLKPMAGRMGRQLWNSFCPRIDQSVARLLNSPADSRVQPSPARFTVLWPASPVTTINHQKELSVRYYIFTARFCSRFKCWMKKYFSDLMILHYKASNRGMQTNRTRWIKRDNIAFWMKLYLMQITT